MGCVDTYKRIATGIESVMIGQSVVIRKMLAARIVFPPKDGA